MRKCVKKFVALAAESFEPPGPVYEFGALQVPGQEGFADLRPLFPGRRYVGADLRPGPGVDRILDLHRIELADGAAGTVLCLDTLEHVEYPRRALAEIHRILAPSGIALISSVMDYPIHDYPGDYWRFTPMAFKSLLEPFRESFVGFAGPADYPDVVVGVGFKGSPPELESFLEGYRRWRAAERWAPKRIANRLTPPLARPCLDRVWDGLVSLKRKVT